MPLTREQVDALNAGGAVRVEGMESKEGEGTYSRFVHIDRMSGRPVYTLYNPDSPEGDREIIIPQSLGGVEIPEEDRKLLAGGKDIFVKDMLNRYGETYSSFVRLDMESGVPMYARHPDEFGQTAGVPVPQKILGQEITGQNRADLQEGKGVYLTGLQGMGGKAFDSWVTFDPHYGKVNYHDSDPNVRQGAGQGQSSPRQAASDGRTQEQGHQAGGGEAAKGQQQKPAQKPAQAQPPKPAPVQKPKGPKL
ncbi:hypothetical protein FACS1894159_06780 [Bacteroidia bacterium]|nr:hypothetical protein FACS1894159_06780 [Bacteroidia bacterium]